MVKLLLERGANIDIKDSSESRLKGNTPLHVACLKKPRDRVYSDPS